ncbi:MAG: hypothetical protein ACFFDH_04480 [Promethearchaeota archaeon]
MSKIEIVVKENERQKYIFVIESENKELNKKNIVLKRDTMDYWI